MPSHGEGRPDKPRRRKPEAAVHGGHAGQGSHTEDGAGADGKIHRTYSANFTSRRYRHKVGEMDASSDHEPPEHDHPDKSSSRRQLRKENSRIQLENQQLMERFDQLEDLSAKKIAKLREKVQSLQTLNGDIGADNVRFKEEYGHLRDAYEELQRQHDLCKFCKSCEELQHSLEVCVQENAALKTVNAGLNEDVAMLKTVVYRLNVQMERYQETLRRSNIKTPGAIKTLQRLAAAGEAGEAGDTVAAVLSEQHLGHVHTPLSWGKVNGHTLGPLLDAYQDTVAEKDEIIQAYEAELSSFTGRLKEVLGENEALYHRLTADDECSVRLKVEVEGLRRELRAAKEHNDILIKKCSLKQDKMEEILKCYEAKVEQLKRDYNVLHEQYYQSRNEVTALKEKNKSLIDAQDEFKNERQNYIPVSVHTSSVNECKKWYEELKFQYETEKRKLKDSLDAQNKVVEDLQNKIAALTNEKEELNNKVKHMKDQLKKAEARHLEIEHSLNEAQLAKTACRKQLNKAMSFARDLVAEQEALLKVLNERQKENKAVKRIGTEIATRMDSLKNQLKTVQKDAWQELTTVEQRIEEQNNIIENMKEEHQLELERLKSVIKQQEDNNSLTVKEHYTTPLPHYLLLRDKNK